MKPDNKPDQSFDSIANKFQRNIYGTTKGRLRHILLEEFVTEHLAEREQLRILDAGGGGGEMAEVLLRLGHQVELIDLSAELIESAHQRCGGYENFSAQQISIQAFQPKQGYDLIVCHAVMEWLAEPFAVIETLCSWLNTNGSLSLSFFNQDARLFGNVLYGNFDYIEKGFNVPNRVRLNPNNAHSPAKVADFLRKQGLSICHQAGLRCFHDYLRDKSQQQSEFESLLKMERKYATQHPFMWLGKYFHIIAQR